MSKSLGASAEADQALVSDGAAGVSTLTGFDPSRWEGRIMIRCMGVNCTHSPGACTADPEYQAYIRVGRSKPPYVPSHKLPAWVSSADVLQAIRDLAESGVDKAACWDFTQAIYRLVNAEFAASAIEARSDATGTGAAGGESAASEAGDAQ